VILGFFRKKKGLYYAAYYTALFFGGEEEGRTRGGKLGSVYLEKPVFSLRWKLFGGYTISTREGLDVWILFGSCGLARDVKHLFTGLLLTWYIEICMKKLY